MKNLNFSIPNPSLIGDTILPEPALSALAQRTGQKISFSGVMDELRFLYQGNPYIELTDQPGKILGSWPAMLYGHKNHVSMYQGFFDQVDLEYQGERLHYQYFGENPKDQNNSICFVPWARSCVGHIPGSTFPNLMEHDFGWWSSLARRLKRELYLYDHNCIKSFGGNYVPDIYDTMNIRHSPLDWSCYYMAASRLVIVVQTGICHIMEGMRTKNTIFLAHRNSWMVKDQPSPHLQTPILSIERNGKTAWDEDEVVAKVKEMLS